MKATHYGMFFRDSSSWLGSLPDALLDSQYCRRHRVCEVRYSDVAVEVAGPGPAAAAVAVVLEVTPFSTRSAIKVVAGMREGEEGEEWEEEGQQRSTVEY